MSPATEAGPGGCGTCGTDRLGPARRPAALRRSRVQPSSGQAAGAESAGKRPRLPAEEDLAQPKGKFMPGPTPPLGFTADSIVDTVREPLLVLDADLRVQRASRSFYSTFQVAPEDTEQRLLYDLGNGQWDIPALRRLL